MGGERPGWGGGGSLSVPDRWTQLCPDSSQWSRSISLRIATRSLGSTQVPSLPLSCRTSSVLTSPLRPPQLPFPQGFGLLSSDLRGPGEPEGTGLPGKEVSGPPKVLLGPLKTHGGGETGFIYGGATIDFSWCLLRLFLYGLRLFVSLNSCLITF